ncbi:MAG TPA: hypothetical protein VGG46_02265 [Terriglobales bacterium]|jgi:hypothetical protein
MSKKFVLIAIFSFVGLPAWSQTTTTGIFSGGSDQAMMAPPPVSIGGDSVAFSSELERSNYLRGGVSVQGSYNDNVVTTTSIQGDASYTISPYIAIDISRSRLLWTLDYSPGFTIYQKFSPYDQADHNLSTGLQYLLTPHVAISLQESLAKEPSFQSVLEPNSVNNLSNTLQTPSFAIIPPLTSTLNNNATGQLTYQFARNAMIGFEGDSSELRFLNGVQAQGLFDSSERGGGAFYAHRVGAKHYIGVNYNFSDIVTHPSEVTTQVHTTDMFYTLYLGPRISLSFSGGAQHSETQGGGVALLQTWSPTEGGGFNVQGIHNSMALTISHSINSGGGLQGAVHSYAANFSVRHQFSPHLTGGVQTNYSNNDLLETSSQSGSSGRTLIVSATLQRALGQHLNAELGYSRIHQRYKDLAIVANTPDSNRGWIMISYEFERPLGR